jgi:hypothetical protein
MFTSELVKKIENVFELIRYHYVNDVYPGRVDQEQYPIVV